MKINATARLKATQVKAATAKDAGKLTLMFNNFFGKYKKNGLSDLKDAGSQMIEWTKGRDRASIELLTDTKNVCAEVYISGLRFGAEGDFAGAVVKQLLKSIDREIEEYENDVANDPKDGELKKSLDNLKKFRSCLH